MNSILHNYNDLLKKLIFETFSNNLKSELDKIEMNNGVMNYISLLANLDETLCESARNSLINIFEKIDQAYKNSSERKCKYDIKSYHTRTIMTVFGEITYKRTFYVSKLTNKNFCYVDRLLGLHKYDFFDPYLKALILEYAANHSMPKIAKYINDLIGNRIKIKSSFNYLSRQTIRNIIMNAKISKPEYKAFKTPSTIHIIADEKWIPTQNNNQKRVMQKSIVVFEGIENNKLKNKQIFASLDNSFLKSCLDYIYCVYDIDSINYIYFMGDGASWIKNLRSEFKMHKDLTIIQGLDKFHFKQSLRHISPIKNITDMLEYYVINNKKQLFIKCCDVIIEASPNRKTTIEAKKQYILNNFNNIKNMYKYNLSCPMEAQISHNIADLFTSRPKAFAIKTIQKLTQLRLLYKNNYNIKELFLNNFNSHETLNINNANFNFSIFEKKETSTLMSKPAKIKLKIY